MKANEFLQAMDNMDNNERFKLLSALFHKHFDNGSRPNPFGDMEVKSVTEEQLVLLRKVIEWRSNRDVAQTQLKVSGQELDNALVSCRKEGIPHYIVSLMLHDENGSGAKEILSEYEIEII